MFVEMQKRVVCVKRAKWGWKLKQIEKRERFAVHGYRKEDGVDVGGDNVNYDLGTTHSEVDATLTRFWVASDPNKHDKDKNRY